MYFTRVGPTFQMTPTGNHRRFILDTIPRSPVNPWFWNSVHYDIGVVLELIGRCLFTQIHRAFATFEMFSKSILMPSFKMGFQLRSLCKTRVTKIASKRPFLLMNCIGVKFQSSASRKFFFAQVTCCFLWLNSFMIYSDVISQTQGGPICFSAIFTSKSHTLVHSENVLLHFSFLLKIFPAFWAEMASSFVVNKCNVIV